MQRRKYAPPEDHAWMTRSEMKTELGIDGRELNFLLHTYQPVFPVQRARHNEHGVRVWPVAVCEFFKAIRGQPYRGIDRPGEDWLSRYQQLPK